MEKTMSKVKRRGFWSEWIHSFLWMTACIGVICFLVSLTPARKYFAGLFVTANRWAFTIQDLYIAQISNSFIITSLLSLFSTNSVVIYWEDIMESRLMKPRYINFVCISGYIFSTLLVSSVAVFTVPEMIVIPFLLSLFFIAFMSVKMIGVFYGRDLIKKDLVKQIKKEYTAYDKINSKIDPYIPEEQMQEMGRLAQTDKQKADFQRMYAENEKKRPTKEDFVLCDRYLPHMNDLTYKTVQAVSAKNLNIIDENMEILTLDGNYLQKFIKAFYREDPALLATMCENDPSFPRTSEELVYLIRYTDDLILKNPDLLQAVEHYIINDDFVARAKIDETKGKSCIYLEGWYDQNFLSGYLDGIIIETTEVALLDLFLRHKEVTQALLFFGSFYTTLMVAGNFNDINPDHRVFDQAPEYRIGDNTVTYKFERLEHLFKETITCHGFSDRQLIVDLISYGQLCRLFYSDTDEGDAHIREMADLARKNDYELGEECSDEDYRNGVSPDFVNIIWPNDTHKQRDEAFFNSQ